MWFGSAMSHQIQDKSILASMPEPCNTKMVGWYQLQTSKCNDKRWRHGDTALIPLAHFSGTGVTKTGQWPRLLPRWWQKPVTEVEAGRAVFAAGFGMLAATSDGAAAVDCAAEACCTWGSCCASGASASSSTSII
eukprot:2389714-Amphidinium_carterae.1